MAQTTQTHSGIEQRVLQIAFQFLIQTAVLFLPAGTWAWVWGWVLMGLYVVMVVVNSYFLMRYDPAIIGERARGGANAKTWDKVISALWAITSMFCVPLVAGLDLRWSWTGEMSLAWHLAGTLAFILGSALFSWAMITNAYFSTGVRIQTDRGHQVCTSGPYHYVRHPGYVGAIVQTLAIPFLLGSLWALIPGLLAMILIIIRTALEDRTLFEELPGYQSYTLQTPYRLVPGIW